MRDLKAIRFIEGTKISHDYEGDRVTTFSYKQLVDSKTPCIGIPAKQNGLLIIDVDVISDQHRHDGTAWWKAFIDQHQITPTYTVKTPSGGYHFYYKMPDYINPDTFSPPSRLADGVDVKWNGWVGAPPTHGYVIDYGSIISIAEAPKALLDHIADAINNKPSNLVMDPNAPVLTLHKPYSELQIEELKKKIDWASKNSNLSYHEWRDGLFSLKAGVQNNDDLLLDLAMKWTYNKNYTAGDEYKAEDILKRATTHGGIGPGTIFSIIKEMMIRDGAIEIHSPFTVQEILDKSKIPLEFDKNGKLKIPPTENNAASIILAMFSTDDLYHDVRNDHYMFKGKASDENDIINFIIPLLQSPIQGIGLENFKRNIIASGLEVALSQRKFDPHKKMVEGVVWDGVPRVETFCAKYLYMKDDEYSRRVGMNMWTALAARALKPGCKFDTMIVLEGSEGIRKTTIIEAIGGRYSMTPTTRRPFDDMDDLRKMHQSVVVELPELIGLVNQDPETVKAFLSKSHDEIRALYARKSIKSPRGFVIFGSTNSFKYLKKSMGHRRFWPLRIPEGVKSVNVEGIKADRDQLFAEGAHLFKQGFEFYSMPSELLDPIVSLRVEDDPIVEVLKNSLTNVIHESSTSEIYKMLEVSGYINKGLTSVVRSRIEESLKAAGYECLSGKWSSKTESRIVDVSRFFKMDSGFELSQFI